MRTSVHARSRGRGRGSKGGWLERLEARTRQTLADPDQTRPVPPGPALHARALRITRLLEDVEAALSRTLAQIREDRAYTTFWFGDLEQYAAKALGIRPARTRDLLRRDGRPSCGRRRRASGRA